MKLFLLGVFSLVSVSSFSQVSPPCEIKQLTIFPAEIDEMVKEKLEKKGYSINSNSNMNVNIEIIETNGRTFAKLLMEEKSEWRKMEISKTIRLSGSGHKQGKIIKSLFKSVPSCK